MQFGGQRRINEGVKLRGELTMSEEKQIKEKKELTDIIQKSAYKHGCFMFGGAYLVTEDTYNAGYRKQKEGEWIGASRTHELICNLCGAIGPVDCLKEDFYESNFCPNCGAKMKGGAK
jgi:hypothetical protein